MPWRLPLVTQQAWKSGVSVFPMFSHQDASWKGFLEAKSICLQMFNLGFLRYSEFPPKSAPSFVYLPPQTLPLLLPTYSSPILQSQAGVAMHSLSWRQKKRFALLPFLSSFPSSIIQIRICLPYFSTKPHCTYAHSGPIKIQPGLWTLLALAALLFRPRLDGFPSLRIQTRDLLLPIQQSESCTHLS